MAYASTTELAAEPYNLAPSNAQLLLDRASRDIDRALLCAVYDPADADVLAALRDATLEQVCYRLSQGDTDGLLAGYQQVSIGSVSISKSAGGVGGSAGSATLGAQAFTILQLAGLTGLGPQTF